MELYNFNNSSFSFLKTNVNINNSQILVSSRPLLNAPKQK